MRHNLLRRTKQHKYHATAIVYRGWRFDSKLEAAYCQKLDLLKDAGEVIEYLRQVPIHLDCGDKLVVDFLIFLADGSVELVDTKGVETREFKRKLVQLKTQRPALAEIFSTTKKA